MFVENVILQLLHDYLMNTKLKNIIYFKYNQFVILLTHQCNGALLNKNINLSKLQHYLD